MITNTFLESYKKHFLSTLAKGNIAPVELVVQKEDNPSEHELRIFKRWYENITQLGFLDVSRSDLEEIHIHSPTQIIYKYHLKSQKEESDITTEDLQAAYEVLTLKNQVSWNFQNPFVSFDIVIHNHSLRVTLLHFSLSPNKKSKCFIRKHSPFELNIGDFSQSAQQSFIQNLVIKKHNVLIAGCTGAGKTTFLNSLLRSTKKTEHLLVLEDVNEISVPHPNTTKLLSEFNCETKTLTAYMSYALRVSPDRIVIGELRSKEVESYLLAMNTGHRGLLSTIHANSAKDALERVALLFKIYSNQDLSYDLVLKLVCQNIDYVIYLENKKCKEVIQVFGSEKENIFYEMIES